MKKPVLILIVLFAIGSGSWAWYQNQKHNDHQNTLTIYGNVDIREVRLSFNASEHIDRMFVDEGDPVKQGQLLASLHTGRLIAGRDRARAQLKAAQARVAAAEKTFHRIRNLAARKLASNEEKDEAEAAYKAELAQVEASEAALVYAGQLLKDAELFAPADGVIRERILEPGDMASPLTPVFTLALVDPVWVRAYLPETALGKVRPGMRAVITTDSFPDKTYLGWVGYISPTAEFTPKTVQTPELRTRLVYRMRVYACNPESELRLGMPATVAIAVGEKDRQDTPGRKVCQTP